MKIQRTELINSLTEFALRGHGIILGAPGAGKTYSLWQLRDELEKRKINNLFLAVDKLGSATEEELRSRLKFDGNFLDKLRASNPRGQTPGILIIDGFDAARDEQKKDRVLWYIKQLIHNKDYSGHWTVIVSIRTYDAKKSQDLQKLFPLDQETKAPEKFTLQDSDIYCRNFFVPLLEDAEVRASFGEIKNLESLYSKSEADFKNLLRLPFNLWLLEQLLTTGADLKEFSGIRSAVQLLGLFWKRRISNSNNGETKNFILTKFTREMVSEKTLSLRKERIYDPALSKEWDELLSSEIINSDEIGQRISYHHNILFDYAVSILLIENSAEELIKFISADPSRPLFLRPSITYFFTRLWHDQRTIFWKAFWQLLASTESASLKLFARLVPPAVIVAEAKSPDDLKPLFDETKNPAEAILRIIQATKMLNLDRESLWVNFYYDCSGPIKDEFAWELTTAITSLVNREAAAGQTIEKPLAQASRNLLSWVWKNRSKSKPWIDQLGANFLAPNVAISYGDDPKAAKEVLKPIFEIIKEENFPINFIYRVADKINYIWPYDQQFVGDLYLLVFGYDEKSEEQTHMGGFVMPLMSTRRQDYDMCRYILVERYKDLLKSNRNKAIIFALKLINHYIAQHELAPYLKKGKTIESARYRFAYRGKQAIYLTDISSIWNESGLHEDKPIKMASNIFEQVETIVKSNDAKGLEEILDIFAEHAEAAYFWKRLLKLGIAHPKLMAPYLFELVIAKPIIDNTETIYETGEFLKKAYTYFDKAQKSKIEKLILEFPKKSDSDKSKARIEVRKRLLACLPKNLLVTDVALKAYDEAEKEGMPSNRPYARFYSSSRAYTTEMWLEEQGAKTKQPENKELIDSFTLLENFSKELANKAPDLKAIENILPHIKELYAKIKSKKAQPVVIETTLSKLGSWAELVLKNENISAEVFELAKNLLIDCAVSNSPEPSEHDKDYSSASWSSSPRVEAAQGLPKLLYLKQDARVLELYKKLINDSVPSVRYLATQRAFYLAKQYESDFWTILKDRSRVETNDVVKQGILYSLSRVLLHNSDESVKILEILFTIEDLKRKKDQTLEFLNNFIVTLALIKEHPWAIERLNYLLNNPKETSSAFNDAAHEFITEVTPRNLFSTDEKRKKVAADSIPWIEKFIDHAYLALKQISSENKTFDEPLKATVREIYSVIDNVVTRFYFSSGIYKDEQKKVTEADQKKYYETIKPLLDRVLKFAVQTNEGGVLYAATAHHFMEMLNGFLKYDPSGVLNFASRVAQASKPYSYNLDSFSIGQVTQLVETILADHRSEVREGQGMNDLITILDISAEAGWTEALKLIWKLDEIYR